MKRIFVLSILALVALFAAETAVAQPEEDDDTIRITVQKRGASLHTQVLKDAPDPDRGRSSRPGSIIVKFRQGTPQSQRELARQGSSARFAEPLLLPDSVRLQVPANATAPALDYLRRLSWVESAEPDLIVHALETPNDPSFGQQWGMARINMPTAWDTTHGSSNVRVAILDCGILSPSSAWGDANGFPDGHPDVGPKVVLEANFSTSPSPDDFCNHGTHVAGIAAAITNNGTGVAGVGYDTRIVNVKVLDDTGTGSSTWIINGILWAANCASNGACSAPRADVINMSLGAAGSCPSAMQSAINIAHNNGVVIVAAAGNGGDNSVFWPAICNNVIAVGASTAGDNRASFSNYGSWVDVFAPGQSILSTDYVGGYASFSGTSMASPHVAGLAALLKSLPGYNDNDDIVARIFETANHNVLASRHSVYGLIDAAAAVGSPVPPAPDFNLSCAPATVAVEVGEDGTSVCTLTSVGGFNGAVDLGCSGLSEGIGSCDFSPNPLTPPADGAADSTLTLTGIGAGSDAFTVVATSGSMSKTFDMTFQVTEPGAPPPSGSPLMYFSLRSDGSVGVSNPLAIANEDIVAWYGGDNFGLIFDGSDVGLSSFIIDAFDVIAPNQVLLSFSSAGTINGLSVDDSDIVLFTGTLGEATSGAFSVYFDGSDVGLGASGEDIDAIQLLPDGRLLVSTTGSFSAPAAPGSATTVSGADEDLFVFTPAVGGIGDDSSVGSWAIYFDGSDVGLSTSSSEDVEALSVDGDGKLYLSTIGDFSVTGVAGADEDVFVFTPSSLGSTTAGTFSSSLFFDGSLYGLSGNDIFAIDLP